MLRGHILRDQLRILSIPTDFSTYPAAYATDGSVGTARGPLFGFNLCAILRGRKVKQGRAAIG